MKIEIAAILTGIFAPSSPVVRLRELEEASQELLESNFDFFSQKSMRRWKERFGNNVSRMARNWYRGQGNPNNKCGENGTEVGNRKHGKTLTLIRAHISGDEPCPAVKHLTQVRVGINFNRNLSRDC